MTVQTLTKLMEMRLIFGVCFHLLIPVSDGAITTPPSNRAVLMGTSRVSMSCASDRGFRSISWNYMPVGGSSYVPISVASYVEDSQNQYYAVEQSGAQQINLILNATIARAGTYFCVDNTPQQVSAQLIIINSDPLCSMNPTDPKELLYNQTVKMSCSISYTANTSYVSVDMIWSKDSPATVANSPTPQYTTSGMLTTAVSNITQVAGNFTPFPIFSCNTSFKVTGNPPGSATNAPDYFKSTPLFSSPINVIYLKPTDASSITGAKDGDQVYLGTTVTCRVEGNPPPSYSWLDVTYRNTTNTSGIQIWHSGEYQCTAWNRAASSSKSINVTTYLTTSPSIPTAVTTTTSTTSTAIAPSKSIISGSGTGGGLSDGGKIGIGVGIGVGGMLVLGAILFAVLCRKYEWTKRNKTVVVDKRTNGMEENSERSGTSTDILNTPQYEPLNIHSAQNSNVGPTYAQLTRSTNVDAIEQGISDRTTYENLGYKLNPNECSSAEYEGLQQRELLPSDAYESIKPKQ